MNINQQLARNHQDCKHGAPLGFVNYCDTEKTVIMNLQKVRIDKQGYAPDGTYIGIGKPVYCGFDDEGLCRVFFRAESREIAKHIIANKYRNVQFKR